METPDWSGPDPAAARAALEDVAAAEGHVAERVRSPWWYRVGLGLTMAVALAALGVGGSLEQVLLGRHNLSGVVVVLCLAVVVPLLACAAIRSMGVALNSYWSRPMAGYGCGLAILLGVGLWARYGLDVSWAMVGAGLGALLLTVIMVPRIDAAARHNLRTAR